MSFTSAGSKGKQVFSDFERVLASFSNPAGERGSTSAELLGE